ncbi:Nitrate reductase [Anatilimnocola aggregata]|uniref:Nitrate reductase n=1 Tax=Anatilimnocola aggregata TaxID=2528021 RepID=A0A517Y688_9BACT|nr:nitrate reductase [Anatilimnocola aggregata]QDU25743.1 Nitrate reductase [Anatilimnocola aggregata]
MIRKATELLRQWDGPLTRDLVLSPGEFGLGQVPEKLVPDQTTRTVCGYCSTGCGLQVHLRDGVAINLSPAADYPVNLGMACPKGWEALSVLHSPDRASEPLWRNEAGELKPVSWDDALKTFCSRFQNIIREHGLDSVAFLSTGQIPTEEMVLLGMLTRFGMGWRHGDSNTRQCMATAAVAYKQSLGFDAPPYSYADFEESDLLIFVGANPCVGHPILWERVLRNQREAKIVVIDPRHTETAQAADLHLPLQPKSDLDLLYGLANLLIERGAVKQEYIDEHTNGFADFAEFVSAWPLARIVAATGLKAAEVEQLVEWIATSERVSFWWTMGVNQSYQGVRTAQSLINLALMTGNFGRPGTGANSITGQCNAMGSRLFSNTSALLGGRDFTKPEHRQQVAQILGIDETRIPHSSGYTYDQILEAVRRGEIRGLWIIATNTVHSWMQRDETRETLAKLDFLVVQDMYHTTETAQEADLLLPAAGWGEKEGTFINSERRFGLLKKVARAPGVALADSHIFRLISHYWGCEALLAPYDHPAKVFQLMKRLSQGMPCDITGIEDYAMLEQAGGIQWPLPAGSEPPAVERRLFADGKFFHADGRAKFLFDAPLPMPEPATDHYPLILLTGRGTVSQWHTQTRTAKSAVLRKLYPAGAYLEIHPRDARERGIQPLEKVEVSSRRGRVTVKAMITPTVGRGQVFMPMHYGETNVLTLPHFDPHSRQPSYKDCAVQVRRLNQENQP